MDQDAPHILVVDDDSRLRKLLSRYLTENGFRITSAGDAAEARRKLQSLQFDLLIVDVMMPGESGLSMTAALRKESDVPIVMLTAMGESEARIAGLEAGADDYISKPFEPREMVLRIHNVLRRGPANNGHGAQELIFGATRFDHERGELLRGSRRIRLTDAEAELLRALSARSGDVMSREELAEAVGIEAGGRAVDVAVTRLRRKIESTPGAPRYLLTVRGRGYRLLTD